MGGAAGNTEADGVARLFIAVMVPAPVLAALREAREAFEQAGAPPLRWVRPEGIHLTLKFLGDTALTRQGDIEAAMAEAASATAAHELRLGGFGLFGGRRPRVLWAGLDGRVEELIACAAQLDQSLGRVGFEQEKRPLAAHLTLARVPQGTSAGERAALSEAVKRVAAPSPLALPVTELRLVRSRLGRGGARYETIAIKECAGVVDEWVE